ncbi:MAG: hypothetical protein HY903_00455 [Deltaproteobacteria bacterium]|nr:hypothetical protein [Deltaproteobacteria bacterium]
MIASPPQDRVPSGVGRLAAALWLFVPVALGVALLCSVRYLPGQDLPNHAAIADIVRRLLAGDPAVAQHFDLRLFDFSYRLPYLLLVPLASLFGAAAAVRVVLVAMWVAYACACRALIKALLLPAPAVVLLLPWFFGIQFIAGFLPSLMAVVLLLWSVVALAAATTTPRPGPLVAATVLGLVLGTAPVVLSLLWAASVVAYAWGGDRARWRKAALVFGVGMLPALGFTATRLFCRAAEEPNVLVPVYKHPFRFYAKAFLANLDWPLGTLSRAALVLFIVAVLVHFVVRRQRDAVADRALPPPVRFVAAALGLWLLCLLLIPARTRSTWGINLRAVEPILVLGAALAANHLQSLTAAVGRGLRLALFIVVGLDGVALARGFAHVDQALRDIEPICAALPQAATLKVVRRFHDVAGAAWSFAYHAHGYCVLDRLAYDDGVFPDRHMPIVHTPPPALGRSPEGALGAFDFLLLDTEANPTPPPADGVLVTESGTWRLYRRRDP